MPDEILWRVHLADGSTLYQRGPNGERNGYHQIDRNRLVAFDLWQGDHLICRIDMRPDRNDSALGPKRLIWRKRHIMNDRGRHDVIHLAGWQRTVNASTNGRDSETVQAICYVFEDGTVLLGGAWGGDAEYMHSIVPLACEESIVT